MELEESDSLTACYTTKAALTRAAWHGTKAETQLSGQRRKPGDRPVSLWPTRLCLRGQSTQRGQDSVSST